LLFDLQQLTDRYQVNEISGKTFKSSNMKYFLIITSLLFIQIMCGAQPRVKKVMIDGAGAPLVFLHGATTNMSGLEKPTKLLAPNFMVVRMQSFNSQYAEENKTLPADYSVGMESEGVGYTLDSLGINGLVILVGSSYGGLIALDYALNHQDRIKALILLEPVAFGLNSVRKERPADYDKIEKITIQLKPTAEITEQQVEEFRCLQVNCDSVNIRSLPQWKTWVERRNMLRGLSAPFEYSIDSKLLKTFTKPVLIVTGTLTSPLNKRIDELLHAEMPSSKLSYIQSGHSIPTTAPEELVKMIGAFLEH
jgi:pimeloyl-ACP methyl ester carboxylesterase